MRIDHHPALDARALLPFLAARAVPGVEEVVDGVYRRSLARRLDPRAAPRATAASTSTGALPRRAERSCASTPTPRRSRPTSATIRCSDRRYAPRRAAASPATRTPPSSRCARCSDSRSPSRPPARSPGGWSRPPGSRWRTPVGAVTHRFPTPAALAALDPDALPMPRTRARALVGMAGEPFGEHLPGVGPWTAAYVALRSGDDDAFLPTDLGVGHGLAALGADPLRAAEIGEASRPSGAFAVAHLWAAAAGGRTAAG